MDHRLDTVPLHSARSAVLVNIWKFLQGFLEGVGGNRTYIITARRMISGLVLK
jgi:hypothetical protein